MKLKAKLATTFLALTMACMPVMAHAAEAGDTCAVITPQVIIEQNADGIEPLAEYEAYVGLYGDRNGMYCKSYSNILAYYHRARCSVDNNGQYTARSEWNKIYNTTSASSKTMSATTTICTYIGEGESKRVADGNIYGNTVYRSYN